LGARRLGLAASLAAASARLALFTRLARRPRRGFGVIAFGLRLRRLAPDPRDLLAGQPLDRGDRFGILGRRQRRGDAGGAGATGAADAVDIIVRVPGDVEVEDMADA